MLIRLLFLFGFLISASLANDTILKNDVKSAFLVQKGRSSLVCLPVNIHVGLDEMFNEQNHRSSSENQSGAIAMKLTGNDLLKVQKQLDSEFKKSIDLNSVNEPMMNQPNEKNDESIKTESKLNETKIESNGIGKSTNENTKNEDVTRSEESTAPPTSLELREDSLTDSNDINIQSNDKSSNQTINLVADSSADSNANLNADSDADLNKIVPVQTRGILPQKSENLNGRQTTGIMGSLLGNLHPSKIMNSFNSKNRPEEDSLSLVGDEKSIEQSFKQSLAEQAKEQKQSSGGSSNTAEAVAAAVEGAAEDTKEKVENNLASLENANKETEAANKQSDNNQDTSSSTTASSSTTSTSTTTTAAPVSTQSTEEIEQEKIFEEFFGSRNAESTSLFQSFLKKIGLSSAKALPPAVLREKIQAEIGSARSNQPSLLPQVVEPAKPAPVLPEIVPSILPAIVPAPPTAPQYLATPLPILPTVKSSNPKYQSYDEYNKNLDIASGRYLPANKAYNQPKPAISYIQPPPKPIANYVQPPKPAVANYVQPPKPAVANYVQPAKPAAVNYVQPAKPAAVNYVEPPKPAANYVEPAKSAAVNYVEPPKPAANYVEPAKPVAVNYVGQPPKKAEYVDDKKNDYTTIDKLKGNVNGPVEVPALSDYKDAPKKPIKIKDYVENDQASYRSNDFRLSNLTPFNRVPAFSRYSKVVSSASNGLSRLYPGYKAEKNDIFPIYGMYRN